MTMQNESEILFFKKEIDRLHNEIQQYKDENLSLKLEMKNKPAINLEQIKTLLAASESPAPSATADVDTAQLQKLQERVNEKDDQIQVLSKKVDEIVKDKTNLENGFKEERRLLALQIHKLKESLTRESNEKRVLVETLQACKVPQGKKMTKRDQAYQEVLNLKEFEIKGLSDVNTALKSKLKQTLQEQEQLTDRLRFVESENMLLRGKFKELSAFCVQTATDLEENDAVKYRKIANFCNSVAESKLTVTKGS